LRIRIVGVGRIKERYWLDGMQEYQKRLGPYARVEVVHVPDEPTPDRASAAEMEQIKAREGERILKVLGGNEFVVALDLAGQQVSSEELAGWLQERALRGQSQVALVVGGSLGLAPAVLQRAQWRWCLSRLTLPHQMVPLVLLEQLYRAFKIHEGSPYHK
jgi:23S rRNA (pseudouridine1915-N3)-methyltransferase